jgi:hypothetical protein
MGYAGGNNVGIRHALARGCDYALVLNNDAVVLPDTVRLLVEEGEKNVLSTILAPKVCFLEDPTRLGSLGTSMDWFRLRPLRGVYGQPDSRKDLRPRFMQVIPGSALLLKRKLFESVGFFDESFFLIHEDADLCFRNTKAGFLNCIVPAAVVHHRESQTLSSYPFLTEYYSTRNFLYLSSRYTGLAGKAACAAGVALFSIKNTLLLITAVSSERKKIHGFFAGVLDFFRRRSGPYGHLS